MNLKKCNQCGKDSTAIKYDNRYKSLYVHCQYCDEIAEGGETEESAVRAWNYKNRYYNGKYEAYFRKNV